MFEAGKTLLVVLQVFGVSIGYSLKFGIEIIKPLLKALIYICKAGTHFRAESVNLVAQIVFGRYINQILSYGGGYKLFEVGNYVFVICNLA